MASKYVSKIDKNIYYNSRTEEFHIAMKRQSLGGNYYQGGIPSLNKAREILALLNNDYPKELNTGVDNNYCRSGNIDPMHNFQQYRKQLKQCKTFDCTICLNTFFVNKLNVHHIDHNRDNDSMNNFQVMCTYCHRDHHNKRNADGKFK